MDAKWLDAAVYGGTLKDWLIALGISVAIALAVYLVKPILTRRLEAQALRSNTQIDDALVAALRATRLWLVSVFALSLGSHYLTLPDKHGEVLKMVTAAAFFLQLGFWGGAALGFWTGRSRAKAMASNASAATSLSAISFLAQLVLWTVILLLVLDNFGINITALVGDKGDDHMYDCTPPHTSGSNILSVTFDVKNLAMYTAWENGHGQDAWTPAACNTYIKIDLTQWF